MVMEAWERPCKSPEPEPEPEPQSKAETTRPLAVVLVFCLHLPEPTRLLAAS